MENDNKLVQLTLKGLAVLLSQEQFSRSDAVLIALLTIVLAPG